MPAAATPDRVRDTNPPTRNDRSLLDVRDLVFRHRDRDERVLLGVTVRIRAGDRLLLEGPSGGGKSTLAALLAGCRVPGSGLLLLDGLDRETVGDGGWRRRVVLAPQFHENHVFMGTFAFNALMGRDWPPGPDDLDRGRASLPRPRPGPAPGADAGRSEPDDRRDRMATQPRREEPPVHRAALLQGADLLILDESFAALDPQTLQGNLAFVLEAAPTVLVVATFLSRSPRRRCSA